MTQQDILQALDRASARWLKLCERRWVKESTLKEAGIEMCLWIIRSFESYLSSGAIAETSRMPEEFIVAMYFNYRSAVQDARPGVTTSAEIAAALYNVLVGMVNRSMEPD